MKRSLLFLIAVLLTLTVQAQPPNNSREALSQLDKDKHEMKASTIVGYIEHLRFDALAFIDSMNRYHGIEHSVHQAFVELVESRPELSFKWKSVHKKKVMKLVLIRAGSEDFEYWYDPSDPDIVELTCLAYGFVINEFIKVPSPKE